jgi:hypothetical protein
VVEVGDLCPAAVAPSTTPPPSQVQAVSRGAEEQVSGLRNKATDSEETSLTSLELSALSPLFSPLNRRAFSAPDGVHPGDPKVACDRLAIAWDPAAPAPKGWSRRSSPGPESVAGANGSGVPFHQAQQKACILSGRQPTPAPPAAPGPPRASGNQPVFGRPPDPPARQPFNRRRCPADP